MLPGMSKVIVMLIFVSLLSGCVGDRLDFRHKGEVFQQDRSKICVKSMPGDTMSYYLLSSSENNYAPPLLTENHINNKYPDTCINVTLKENVSYDLIYILSDVKYRASFTLDGSHNIRSIK
jgi:hypothetical protein